MQQWLFLDGAGKPNPERYVSYCGYLMDADEANLFFERWNAVLAKEQIPYLTMKHAMRWDEVWALKRQQWGESAETKRYELLIDLADTVRQSRIFGIGHAVNVSECRDKQIEPTEYYLFVRILEELLRLQTIGSGVQLAVVVDEEESAAERIYKFYRRLRRDRKDVANQIKLVGIGDDRAIPGLQAADMLAYQTNLELKRQATMPDAAPDDLWLRLTTNVEHKSLTHTWLVPEPTEFLKAAGIV